MPYDFLNAEIIYLQGRKISTNEVVLKMAIKVIDCILIELQDLKKVMHNYLSSSEGKFS